MDALESIYDRRVARECTQRPLNKPTPQSLVEAAIAERERLLRLSHEAKRCLLTTMAPGAPLKDRLGPSFDNCYGAPALIVISAMSSEPRAGEDCALAAQSSTLAAHAKGVVLDRVCSDLVEPARCQGRLYPARARAGRADHRRPPLDSRSRADAMRPRSGGSEARTLDGGVIGNEDSQSCARVIYYLRTGTTRQAASALTKMLGADTAGIRCDRHALGGLGCIRAAFDSVRGAQPRDCHASPCSFCARTGCNRCSNLYGRTRTWQCGRSWQPENSSPPGSLCL